MLYPLSYWGAYAIIVPQSVRPVNARRMGAECSQSGHHFPRNLSYHKSVKPRRIKYSKPFCRRKDETI